jgi:DNA/RNA endonuclease YhcR with UshA esterase domain
LGKAYPAQILTAVIFGDDRAKFGEPEKTLQGKRICVTGTIRVYRGAAEVILNDPDQLKQ